MTDTTGMKVAKQLDDAGILTGPASLDIAERFITAAMAQDKARIAKLEEALRPFALAADAFDDDTRVVASTPSKKWPNFYLVARDLFRARTTLESRNVTDA